MRTVWLGHYVIIVFTVTITLCFTKFKDSSLLFYMAISLFSIERNGKSKLVFDQSTG